MAATDPPAGAAPVGPPPAPPALPAPVRARVVTLADATLAGLLAAGDPGAVPSSLRVVARFTPAKRARLGAPMLAAAVEQPEFRARVVDQVKEVAGDLLGAVCAGQPPPAADPVDVAAVAYLARPEGYEDLVAAASEAITAAARRSAGERDRSEIDRLRRDRDAALAVAEERAEAAEQEAAAAAEQAAALHKRIRALTGQLRAAERDRDAAVVEAGRARSEAATAVEGVTEEVGRLREALADAGRQTAAARRTVRSARDADDARLWLLLETLSGAVRGLRDELALTPSELRPADAVATALTGAGADAGAGGGSTRPVDAALLDRLLALPGGHVVVDGYNVTKTGYPDVPLSAQRDRLIRGLGALRARTGAEVTCVFDGADGPVAQPRAPRGVRVLFSRPGEPADDVIRRLVAAEPAGRPVLVVSSDREVAEAARRPGGFAVPAAVFAQRLARG